MKKPLAKLRVPANSVARRFGPPAMGPHLGVPRLFQCSHLLQKQLQCIDGGPQKTQSLLKPRNALRKLGRPGAGRAGNGRPQADDRSEQRQDEQQRREHPRQMQALQDAQDRLQQQLERNGEHEWQHDLGCHIGDAQQRESEKATKENDFRIGGQGHLLRLRRRRDGLDLPIRVGHFRHCIDAYADRRETPTAFAAGSPRTGVPCRTTRRRRESSAR